MMTDRLIWFHHVHKCAGTLVVKTAKQCGITLFPEEKNGNPCRNGDLLPLHQYDPTKLNAFINECIDSEVGFVATEYGSPHFSTLINQPKVVTLTVLRDPWERFLSSYRFCIDCGYTIHRSMRGFENGEAFDAKTNYMTHTFGLESFESSLLNRAQKTLEKLDYVFVVEQPDLAMQLAQIMGGEVAITSRVNAGRGITWRMLRGRLVRGQLKRVWCSLTADRVVDPVYKNEFLRRNHEDVLLYDLAKHLSNKTAKQIEHATP